jgi:hypothetical protein
MLTRLDLPTEAFTRPSWWTSAIYQNDPKRGWIFRGYTPNRWQTFSEHVDGLNLSDPKRTNLVSWVWFNGQWVRAA